MAFIIKLRIDYIIPNMVNNSIFSKYMETIMGGTVNVSGINGVRSVSDEGRGFTTEETQSLEHEEWADALDISDETLNGQASDLTPEETQVINEDFLHSSIAINGLYDAINSATKNQQAPSGAEKPMATGLDHVTREATTTAQEATITGSVASAEL